MGERDEPGQDGPHRNVVQLAPKFRAVKGLERHPAEPK